MRIVRLSQGYIKLTAETLQEQKEIEYMKTADCMNIKKGKSQSQKQGQLIIEPQLAVLCRSRINKYKRRHGHDPVRDGINEADGRCGQDKAGRDSADGGQ